MAAGPTYASFAQQAFFLHPSWFTAVSAFGLNTAFSMANAELACVYAALILSDDGLDITGVCAGT